MSDSLFGGRRGLNPFKMFEMDYYLYACAASNLIIFITLISVVSTKKYCPK